MPAYPARRVSGSVYLAEDDDLLLGVPVEGVGVVDEVAQDLGVVRGGHDERLLGSVVQDQLVGELAVLEGTLAAPVGVDVGDLPHLYGRLGLLLSSMLLAHGYATPYPPNPTTKVFLPSTPENMPSLRWGPAICALGHLWSAACPLGR